MGYSPAPTKPTRILGPDGVPLVGDVSIIPGLAQGVQRQGNGLLLSAQGAQRARGVELFLPGVLAARTGLVVPITDPVLTSVDAYFKTAPAATDGLNFAQLRVKGLNNGSNSVALPFQVNAQNEYHLSAVDLSTVIGTMCDPSSEGPLSTKAMAMPFHPSANVDIGGLGFVATNMTNVGNPPGPTRIGIADATLTATSGHTCDTVPWVKDLAGLPAYVDVSNADLRPSNGGTGSFPYTPALFANVVHLVAGTNYRVVIIGQPTTSVANQNANTGTSNTHTGTGNIVNDMGAGNANLLATVGYNHATSTFQADAGANSPVVKFLGNVFGTPLSGLVSIGVEITGAPATPGSDLAVSVQL